MRDEEFIEGALSTRQPESGFASIERFMSGLVNRAGDSIQAGLEGVDRFGDEVMDKTIKFGGCILRIAGNTLKQGVRALQYLDHAATGPYMKQIPTEFSEDIIQRALNSAR